MRKRINQNVILLVTNNDEDVRNIRSILGPGCKNKYCLWQCSSLYKAIGWLKRERLLPGLVMLDLGLVNIRNLRDSYNEIKNFLDTIPVIVIAKESEKRLVVFAVKAGATSCISRSQFSDIEEVIELAHIRHRIRREDQIILQNGQYSVAHGLDSSSNVEKITYNAEMIKTKDKYERKKQERRQVVSWLTGGYSVEPDPENEALETFTH